MLFEKYEKNKIILLWDCNFKDLYAGKIQTRIWWRKHIQRNLGNFTNTFRIYCLHNSFYTRTYMRNSTIQIKHSFRYGHLISNSRYFTNHGIRIFRHILYCKVLEIACIHLGVLFCYDDCADSLYTPKSCLLQTGWPITLHSQLAM